MNAWKYFTIKYWARKFFAIRPAEAEAVAQPVPPVVLWCGGGEFVDLYGARTDALALWGRMYAQAHAYYAGPVSLRCAGVPVAVLGTRLDAAILTGEEATTLYGTRADEVSLEEGG